MKIFSSVSLPCDAKRDIRVDPFALAYATTVFTPDVPVTGVTHDGQAVPPSACRGLPAFAFALHGRQRSIDLRMSKSQQMRRSPMGAHCLLQVRAELVDGRLGDTFGRWYPGFAGDNRLYQVAA